MSVFDDVSKYYKLRNFKSFKELAEDLDITPNKARTIMNGNFNGNMVDLVKIYWKIGKKVELKITDFKDLK